MTALRTPILYSFRRCPFAMRARLALTVSGVRCELREVRLRAKPAAMLAASPKGTVPVLVRIDDIVLDESLDIMRWALGERDPEDWLEQDDPALIASNDGAFKQDLDRYKYPDRHASDPLVHRDRGLLFLRTIDARLADAAYLCGSARGLIDAAILPFVRQFAAVDRAWFDAQPLPGLQRWLVAYLASDLCRTIMVPVAPWVEGDSPVFLPGLAT
jgi:glutathione S-transferase